MHITETSPVSRPLAAIGLDHKNIMAYLEIARLGDLPVSVLARRLGEKRTTMYYVLERLTAMGLLRRHKRNGVQSYEAMPPDRLIATLHKQQRQITAGQKALQTLKKRVA